MAELLAAMTKNGGKSKIIDIDGRKYKMSNQLIKEMTKKDDSSLETTEQTDRLTLGIDRRSDSLKSNPFYSVTTPTFMVKNLSNMSAVNVPVFAEIAV